MAEQPMREEALLTGALEPTNEWYAIAKIAGIKLCAAFRRQYGCDFVSVMPTNLVRAGRPLRCAERPCRRRADHEDSRREKANSATVELWGSGTPKREFLFTEDLADACVFVMKNYSDELFLNVGTGRDMTILELAESIARVAGWKGTFTFDRSKPDGMPRKVMDVSRLQALGWSAQTPFDEGIKQAYDWYVANVADRAA
jgi:GDP-L-fucose synthase